MLNWLRKIKIGFLHATYHRNMKRAERARRIHDIIEFKKHIYRAEDAWKKLVKIKEKTKING
jgi:hypothetical protein